MTDIFEKVEVPQLNRRASIDLDIMIEGVARFIKKDDDGLMLIFHPSGRRDIADYYMDKVKAFLMLLGMEFTLNHNRRRFEFNGKAIEITRPNTESTMGMRPKVIYDELSVLTAEQCARFKCMDANFLTATTPEGKKFKDKQCSTSTKPSKTSPKD